MKRPCSTSMTQQGGRLLFLIAISQTIKAAVIPPARWGHVSVLCGDRLFVHGGHTGVNQLTAPIGSDIYSLDITTAFNSFSTPWVQLTPGPYATFHSASLIGPENNHIALYGGNTSFASPPSSSTNSLHLYNTLTGAWSPSPLQDPPRRQQHMAVSRLGDGTIFVFGGMVLSSDLLTESPTAELWTLGGYLYSNTNTTSSNSTSSTPSPTEVAQPPPGLSPHTAGWQKMTANPVGSAGDRSYHTATLIRSNGLLVIIGGVSAGSLVSMSEIQVYDTASGTWSVQTATGATPTLRRNHVAVANSKGQIYVHGGTNLDGTIYFADVAILDTTSWLWSQPAIEGTAPTGRYSHAAVMVGSNMVITFGLTAGGATNNIFIFDTTVNTWVTSYTPNNLAMTSTKPEDWPGYKPPPILPPDNNSTDPNSPLPGNSTSNIGPIIGGIAGVVVIAVLIFAFVRRYHQQQMNRRRAQMASYYGPDFSNQASMEQGDAYRHRGMAFDSEPVSFGQKMEQFWGGMGAAAFWRRDRRAENRSQSHRLRDQDEDEANRGVSMPTDQEIFLDAVHRVRSRAGRLSPMFTPLQQPIAPTSPTSPRLSAAGFGSPLRGGREVGEVGELGEEVQVPCMEQEEVPHGRAYSDGFENAMLEMDIQMVGVPRGRLYVVNPSDENVDRDQNPEEPSPDQTYRGFDSQGPV